LYPLEGTGWEGIGAAKDQDAIPAGGLSLCWSPDPGNLVLNRKAIGNQAQILKVSIRCGCFGNRSCQVYFGVISPHIADDKTQVSIVSKRRSDPTDDECDETQITVYGLGREEPCI
jgi:hypothetical protein